jgi:hypothetical protein
MDTIITPVIARTLGSGVCHHDGEIGSMRASQMFANAQYAGRFSLLYCATATLDDRSVVVYSFDRETWELLVPPP